MWKKNIFYFLIIVNLATQAMENETTKKDKKTLLTRIARLLSFLHPTHSSRKEPATTTTTEQSISYPFDVEKTLFDHIDIFHLILSYFYTYITEQKETCAMFARFSVTSKSIYQYFTNNEACLFKKIIKEISAIHGTGDLFIAQSIYKPIAVKIDKLIKTATNEKKFFTQEDLQDVWCLNATFRNTSLKTILFITVSCLDVKKTKTLLQAGARADTLCNEQNALAYLTKGSIIRTHTCYFIYTPLRETNLILILSLLLQKGIDPDSRQNIHSCTLLHLAAQLDHKNIAYLMLLYGANPYATYYDTTAERIHTAFSVEYGDPKGWLKNMYLAIRFFCNDNILSLITSCICTLEEPLPILAQTIQNFSLVNTRLYHYYKDAAIRKNLVRNIAVRLAESDLRVAQQLNYKEIVQQIKTIFSLAERGKLTSGSLKDPWYVDATVPGTKESPTILITPICVTITMLQPKATQMLVKAKCNLGSDRYPNPLAILGGSAISYNVLPENAKKNNFTILKSLLKAKIDPDSRFAISCLTFLQYAARNSDKSMASLLLKSGANPYKLYFNGDHPCVHGSCLGKCNQSLCTYIRTSLQTLPITTCYKKKTNQDTPWKYNAFHLEEGEPKGWLKKMYKNLASDI